MTDSAHQCCTTVMSLAARKRMQKEAGRTDVFCRQDYFRCPNKAKVCRDGKWYCGVHDPVAVRVRHEEQEKRKREKQRTSAALSTKIGDGQRNWLGMSDYYRKEIDRLQKMVDWLARELWDFYPQKNIAELIEAARQAVAGEENRHEIPYGQRNK